MAKYCIGVITPNERLVFSVHPSTLVKDLKREALFKADQCGFTDAILTYRGKVLKDNQSLCQQNVKNGRNIYLSFAEKPKMTVVQKSCRVPTDNFNEMQKHICDLFKSNPRMFRNFLSTCCKMFSDNFFGQENCDEPPARCVAKQESVLSDMFRTFIEQLSQMNPPKCAAPRRKPICMAQNEESDTANQTFNEEAVDELMQQMSENPTLLRDFMRSPQIQEMVQELSNSFKSSKNAGSASGCNSDNLNKYATCLLNMMKQCDQPPQPPSYRQVQREAKCAASDSDRFCNLDSKMKKLIRMGYINRKDNLAALTTANGQLSCAINILDRFYC